MSDAELPQPVQSPRLEQDAASAGSAAPHAESATPARFRYPRAARVCSSAEFQTLMKTGLRAADGTLAVWARRNGTPATRLGLVVGRKHGNSPQRSSLKRRIREAFRMVRRELPRGLDLAVMPHVGARLTSPATQDSLRQLARRLAKRLDRAAASVSVTVAERSGDGAMDQRRER